ncbi:FAD-dependent oxidoreductase [Streptomyces sioyaensis]|uniref:FAD-dependent oxidoreductase n=1 Tax=Streptomyces sioyaensis TaxID=67364 RepID=A0A4Q1QRH8_9ACTN|nr:FAD-dependent oxidoreductase [Streptomyces sioyaensis]MBM4796407.1 FAD-dependent oxidoreductase [Streptomyces sioyaensis]RXS64256.1 FAD-dependent oxidoreductase [Streptomyces sioyaensis]
MNASETPERIVVVGASLAGLRAAEALRDEGFTGELTLIGDEPHAPYDRPPLSKAVLSGWLTTDHTELPRVRDIAARWLLGTSATGLDLRARRVELADGRQVAYDRLLIATGTRARPWPQQQGGTLHGVHVLRTRDDADRLRTALAAGPGRVLVIGAGFTGGEVASVCRDLGLEVTVVHRGDAPLASALGGVVGRAATGWYRDAGVDLRLGTTVRALEGDARGRLRRALLSDGTVVEAEVALVAAGAMANTGWLAGFGLAADAHGVACDHTCRALADDGTPRADVFVAGDVARWPHPLYPGQLLRLDHWDNAVAQARTAAHNMTRPPHDHRAHRPLPAFWSNQFGVNLKCLGLPSLADQVVVTQGSLDEHRFVAAYGHRGRLIAAVAADSPRVLDGYASLIEAGAPFPPELNATDGPDRLLPLDAGFAHRPAPVPDRPTVPSIPPAPSLRSVPAGHE